MSQKRIAVLTLSKSEPRLMLSGVKDGQLHVIKSDRLARSMAELKKTLPKRLEKIQSSGFVLLVDEVIPCFGHYGRTVKLSDMDGNEKPIIASAMEAYLNLTAYQSISYPQGSGGAFEISPSVVEEMRGTDGKAVYNIDWDALNPDSVALLLTVHAATQDTLFDMSSMKELIEKVGPKKTSPSPQKRFWGIVEQINKTQLSQNALVGDNDA